MRFVTLLLGVLCLFIPLSDSLGAAWLQQKGKGLFLSQLRGYTSYSYVNREGQWFHAPTGTGYSSFEWNGRLEYGLTNKWNVIVGLPAEVARNTWGEADVIRWSFRETEVGIKRELLKGSSWTLAAQMSALVPLYSTTGSLPPGYGQLGIEGRVLGGVSFSTVLSVFINAEVAYRKFLSAPMQWIGDLSFGLWASKKHLFILQSVFMNSVYDNSPFQFYGERFNTDFSFWHIGLSYFFVKRSWWWLGMGATRDIYNRNSGVGQSLTASVIFLW